MDLGRRVRLSYVMLVTAASLALVAEAASRGPEGLPSACVYALVSGFGLEFVLSGWAAERRSSKDDRPLAD
jgi:hypothetical protein